jgi:hypothetical protein
MVTQVYLRIDKESRRSIYAYWSGRADSWHKYNNCYSEYSKTTT